MGFLERFFGKTSEGGREQAKEKRERGPSVYQRNIGDVSPDALRIYERYGAELEGARTPEYSASYGLYERLRALKERARTDGGDHAAELKSFGEEIVQKLDELIDLQHEAEALSRDLRSAPEGATDQEMQRKVNDAQRAMSMATDHWRSKIAFLEKLLPDTGFPPDEARLRRQGTSSEALRRQADEEEHRRRRGHIRDAEEEEARKLKGPDPLGSPKWVRGVITGDHPGAHPEE